MMRLDGSTGGSPGHRIGSDGPAAGTAVSAAAASEQRPRRAGGLRAPLRLGAFVLLAAGIGGVLVLRPSAEPEHRSSRRPLITVAEAEHVLAQLWPRRERALAGENAAALAQLDTGAALKRDLSALAEARRVPGAMPANVLPLGQEQIGLSLKQKSPYPAAFLALVSARGRFEEGPAPPGRPEGTFVLVVRKASARAPWRVAMETFYSGSPEEFLPEAEPEGAGRQPTASARGRRSPAPPLASDVSALAAYYQHYSEYGSPPPDSPFLAGPWTTSEGHLIAQAGLRYSVSAGGIRHEASYALDAEDGIYDFAVDGHAVSCGTVGVSEVDRPAAPGGYIVQPQDRSQWGEELAPGLYSVIHTGGEHQVCIARVNGGEKLEVLSGEPSLNGRLAAVSGTRVERPELEAPAAANEPA